MGHGAVLSVVVPWLSQSKGAVLVLTFHEASPKNFPRCFQIILKYQKIKGMDLERTFPESITQLKVYLAAHCCLHGFFPTTAASCSLYSSTFLRVWLQYTDQFLSNTEGRDQSPPNLS